MAIPVVFLKTPLAANTGYGHDGFALACAFTQAGLDVRLVPTVVSPPIPMGVAQLLVKDLSVDCDYFVHHVSPDQLGLNDGEKRLKAKKIAWSMWEFTHLTPPLAATMTEQLEGYDLFLAYDEVSAEAFGPACEAAGVPLKILQGGFWSEDWEMDLRTREWFSVPFRFVMVGQLHARKNPFAAINAFREVHEALPDTELHLKTNVRGLHPAMESAYPGLRIFYEVWDPRRLKDFYAQAHCYVAPSWGEGKNLPAMEASAMGVPPIYSNFGGHRQWADSAIGWPVNGVLEAHEDELFSIRVDHDELVAAMIDAATNRGRTKIKGEAASRQVFSMCDWSVAIRRFLTIV